MPAAGKLVLALCQAICAGKNCLCCWQVVQVYVLSTEQDLSEVHQVPMPAAWPTLSKILLLVMKRSAVERTSGSELTMTPSKSRTNTSDGSLGRGRFGAPPTATVPRRSRSCAQAQHQQAAPCQCSAQQMGVWEPRAALHPLRARTNRCTTCGAPFGCVGALAPLTCPVPFARPSAQSGSLGHALRAALGSAQLPTPCSPLHRRVCRPVDWPAPGQQPLTMLASGVQRKGGQHKRRQVHSHC